MHLIKINSLLGGLGETPWRLQTQQRNCTKSRGIAQILPGSTSTFGTPGVRCLFCSNPNILVLVLPGLVLGCAGHCVGDPGGKWFLLVPKGVFSPAENQVDVEVVNGMRWA